MGFGANKIIIEIPKFILKKINTFPGHDREAIKEAFNKLESDGINNVNIIKMVGIDSAYRYRVGKYRIVFTYLEKANIILIQAIGTRGDIYNKK